MTLPTGDAWRPGLEVGGHVLIDVLGRGGMGAVWRVEHAATGARRALKVLRGATHPEDLLRFRREVEALGRLDGHPNVVRVHTAGVHLGSPWVVTELVEGGDLASRLKQGPLDAEAAAALVRDVARGVAHAHARGVLHRDLKPANVLLDASGVARLTDFGLARLSGAETLTQTGTLLGTPAYMAPEQARGERADERTDVWGLGALLYHALSGRAPGDGDAPMKMLARLAEARIEPLLALRPDVPRGLDEICRRALAGTPTDRWPDAASLATALDRWLSGERGGSSTSWKALLLAGGGTVAVAAALGAAWLRVRDGPTEAVRVVSSRAVADPGPPRSPPPETSPAPIDWPARMAERTPRPPLTRTDPEGYARLGGITTSVARGESLTTDQVDVLERLARQGEAEAQTGLARHLRGQGADRGRLMDLLWCATRNPTPDLFAVEDLLAVLHEEAPSAEGAERTRWLLAEGSARARRQLRVELAAIVARESTRWGSAPGDFGRALRLLKSMPEVALDLRARLRGIEGDPALLLLVGISEYERRGSDADRSHAARALTKVLRGPDGPPRTFALLWLERHAPDAEWRRRFSEFGVADAPRGGSLYDEWTEADRCFETIDDP